jgi:hypothetical protein
MTKWAPKLPRITVHVYKLLLLLRTEAATAAAAAGKIAVAG